MELLPQDPRKRRMMLIIAGAGAALVGIALFFIMYVMPAAPSEIQQTASIAGGKVSEGSLKIIEGNIAALRSELQNDFYKSLKQYKTVPDTAAPGKQNPFQE